MAGYKYDPNLPQSLGPGETYQSNPDDVYDIPYAQNSREGNAAQYAVQAFKRLYKRNPTPEELSKVLPAYVGGDKNITDVSGGDSIVAQMHDQEVNTPEKQYADQQAKYKADAPKFYEQINGQFKSTLGRDATQEERDHFGSLLASGQVDPYTISTFLSQLPEAVTKQDAEFRNSLRTETSAADSRYFGEQIMPGIQRNFSNQGRSVESSGFANALAQAAQQQNVNREGFLTNLSASQYTGNKATAYSDYLNSVGRTQGLQDYSRSRRDMLADATTSRINDISNFNFQKQAYDQYLQRYGKRTGGTSGAIGGAASGAAIGTSISPGWGTAIGAVGGGLAGYFG